MIDLSRTELLGSKLTEAIPEIKDPGSNLLKAFGHVALSGESARIEYHSEGPDRWYEITAYRFEPRCFATIIRDITEDKNEEIRNHYLSHHDSLTGLYNRYFLEAEMLRLDTARQLPISIIIADIDGLKLVNDTYGYNKGDQLIRKASAIIKDTCRKEDIVTRWGGDEFLILLPQTSAADARELCERISNGCREAYQNSVPISMTLGTAVKNSPDEALTEVQKRAEDQMQNQKLSTYKKIKSAFLKSVYHNLMSKSFETEEHIRRVREISLQIGEKLALPKSEMNRLAVLVLLHDIGKVKIIEDILTKKGMLDTEEWEKIKKHPEAGCRIARASEEFAYVAEDILSHHEHWDGTGYPQGLKGEEIPLLARIMAIADAYEVMTCGRPYKKAMTPAAAASELRRCAGLQFDPQLVGLFLSLLGINKKNDSKL
jgi:diguanylate cyclase (GGDEF)-like protein